jgi:RNA polymerase sigma factor (sigma-70 family)
VQELNSQEFIAKLKAGDNDAFGTLFIKMLPKLSYFISKWFNIDPGAAEELASDALAKVHHNVAKFDPRKGAKLTTWVYIIAKNTARDYIRQQSHIVRELPIDQDISIGWVESRPKRCNEGPTERCLRPWRMLRETNRGLVT